jgi:hypothetical protein
MAAPKKWVPLESNPDVLTDFAQKLGLDTSQYSFCDVYGLDPVSNRIDCGHVPACGADGLPVVMAL